MVTRTEFVWLSPADGDYGVVFCPRCMCLLAITTTAGLSAELERIAEQQHALVIAHTRALESIDVEHTLCERADQHRCPALSGN
jgi:hypothetical protein